MREDGSHISRVEAYTKVECVKVFLLNREYQIEWKFAIKPVIDSVEETASVYAGGDALQLSACDLILFQVYYFDQLCLLRLGDSLETNSLYR